jgi:hypothetical protein
MSWFKKISSGDFYEWFHGTDSPVFDEFDPSRASKGDAYYNPLGSGMYVTNKPDFARMFGKNVYDVRVPKDCKIKRLSPRAAVSAITDIIMRSMRKVGIDYRNGTHIRFKVELGRLLDRSRWSPYDSIMESATLVALTYPDKAEEFYKWVGNISTKKFSKFDVIIFKGTNNPNDIYVGECPTKEIIIFNPVFQKVFAGDLR